MNCSFICYYLSLLIGAIYAHELDIEDPKSIKDVSGKIAKKLMQMYPGNKPGGIPGLFPEPYYWWEAGAVFGGLVDYWYYTNDNKYVLATMEAMLHQVGPEDNYMPPNQTKSLGNDDQAFWGLAAMSAAEKNFPNPPKGKPQWLALAQAVFNTQVPRWEKSTCGGGLRWQIFTFNKGYDYKNTISNGCFFLLASRLARYTGNNTYVEWAEKSWDWTRQVGLMTDDYRFWDGANVNSDCSTVDVIQWSYNAAIYLAGAAYLYNYTDGKDIWRKRVDGILTQMEPFFVDGVMTEQACEPYGTCNVDQRSFKAYLARFMALTVKMAPWTADTIMPKLRTSAVAAARHCSNGADKNFCGLRWTVPTWDGYSGVGEQLSGLEAVQSLLIYQTQVPFTDSNGGTSVGNPGAGMGEGVPKSRTFNISMADVHGARALTSFIVIGFLIFTVWMVV
ncbi:putative cell wall glycosyl hydrolase Dfg5 [Geopyxis carbonaria]|nr:putative cell wall glycosyl hydrolase Dfg5 [Geopyxis carbonaria]